LLFRSKIKPSIRLCDDNLNCAGHFRQRKKDCRTKDKLVVSEIEYRKAKGGKDRYN
jgi:hypothetical protein